MRYRFIALTLLFALLLTSTTYAQRGVYDLPDPFADAVSITSTITTTRAGRLFISDTFSDTVSLLDLDRTIQAEYSIGANPRGVSITPDNLQAVAISDSSLAVIDLNTGEVEFGYDLTGSPYGVIAGDGVAYVSLQATNEVIIMELESGRVLDRIATPPSPSAMAKWGDFLYVTHFWSGELSLIYLPTTDLVRTIQPNPSGTLFGAIEIDPINGRAFLPQSIANTASDATDGNRIIPMLYEVNLRTLAVTRSINMAAADRNVNMPFAVRQPSNRSRLYVAHAGSDAVTVLNLDTGAAEEHIETGNHPRGMVFNSAFTLLYTHDTIDGTVSEIDVRFFAVNDQIPLTTAPIDPATQIGLDVFYSATDERISSNGLMSCASCHWGGQSDGRMWLNAPTPVLEAIATPEPAWINAHLSQLQGGTGLDPDGIDMNALLDFLSPSG
ncbi:MAG: YncE family protein [Chloroflexota bacterium]